MAGTQMSLHKYTIHGNLGSGSYGRVYHAENEQGLHVAIKTFEPSPGVMAAIAQGQIAEAELKRRFFAEAKYQGKISHPNVVAVIDSDLSVEPPFFVMEKAVATLANDLLVDRTLAGKPEKALFDVLSGLEAIHELGIYHRDLKPQNVLRIDDGLGNTRYAISDFGLMKTTTGDSTTLTATGAGGGTERYAAPELMGDFKRATTRSDIFSFGVFLWDIFVGPVNRVPYTEVQFSGAVGLVAAKCTKRLPARRYASVAELRSALFESLKQEPQIFSSSKEQDVLNLLKAETPLNDQQWDQIFLALEEADPEGKALAAILLAFTKTHLLQLCSEAPDLLAAFSSYYLDYVDEGEGKFDFDYSDVIADKLSWLFELGEISIKAKVILSMLVLGTSHNRWKIEHMFTRIAGATLDVHVADRVCTEVEISGFAFEKHIAHIERSINVNRKLLHPLLHRLWEKQDA
jgi:eukaryotic-like serine/threonine-protein kinase